jgi:hypothetical protein
MFSACSEQAMVDKFQGEADSDALVAEDAVGSIIDDTQLESDIKVHPDPTEPCVQCQWYFCPPLNSVWQKEICFDICSDPKVVLWESECLEYLECDPTQSHIEFLDCVTEDGYPGSQEKICNKGKIQYTNCETDCFEEICDYIDNDCDGDIDEEVQNSCGGCGDVPEEACDYIDNDCDGEVDEGQLNICGECGVVPSETCDGLDNDCDGEVDEELIQTCSTACGAGYEMCSDGSWISCNAPQPQVEICDGLDNDCDGQIDEELECLCTVQDVGALFPCMEEPLICGQGYKTCECTDPTCTEIVTTPCFALCNWLPQDPNNPCDPLIGMALENEMCNNFDDNCNQLIDENLYAACYTGPEGTINVGICLPGEMTCDKGEWGNYDTQENFIGAYCKDEVVPQPELCNGIDDNCDGITDWGEEMPETDILFVIDWSGSMSDEISAVLIALNTFAQNFSDEEVLKWGLVRGPVPLPNDQEFLELTQELVGFSDFLLTMSQLDTSYGAMSTAFEMLLDAVYLSVSNISGSLPKAIPDLSWESTLPIADSIPTLQNFIVNWRPGVDRIIIVFTDEPEQSYLNPKISLLDVIVATTSTPQLKVYTFSKNSLSGWGEISDATNGKDFKLTSNPTNMYNNLMEILDEICKNEE